MGSTETRIPGVSDRGTRRYRSFRFDFDSRALFLDAQPNENWDEEAAALWRENHASRIADLTAEYGSLDIERKIADFRAFGAKPFSIIAHHNQLFDQVRSAFVSGGYYAALTAHARSASASSTIS
jgi:hypothetical protein